MKSVHVVLTQSNHYSLKFFDGLTLVDHQVWKYQKANDVLRHAGVDTDVSWVKARRGVLIIQIPNPAKWFWDNAGEEYVG
jgi:hypothetical protein